MTARNHTFSTGAEVRLACRSGKWTGHTACLAPGFAQANLVSVPLEFASDFHLFCERNPQACPVLAITEPGSPSPPGLAPDADLRTDLPRYCVWQGGRLVAEPLEISGWWRDDLVSFLIGCSFTFDDALRRAGLSARHIEENRNVSMYRTSIRCLPAGPFQCPLVVSMRPFKRDDVEKAVRITSRFVRFHGRPVHTGDPGSIGIPDLSSPDFGDPVSVRDDEVPVFWACGVTPQCALMEACLPFAITHSPGHMFITDRKNDELL